MNKPNINNNIIGISRFKCPFSSTGLYFKSKVIEGSHKVKKYAFLNFGQIFQNVHFGYPINSIVSSAQALRIYKIHVFDEAFFLLTIRMPPLTKLLKVLTYRKELPLVNLHDTSVD